MDDIYIPMKKNTFIAIIISVVVIISSMFVLNIEDVDILETKQSNIESGDKKIVSIATTWNGEYYAWGDSVTRAHNLIANEACSGLLVSGIGVFTKQMAVMKMSTR